MEVAAPERQQPCVDLDRGRDVDYEGRGREEEAEIGVHARYVHVVHPDEEAERADDDDRPDHHPVAEDVLAGVDADELGADAEGGQRADIALGVAEEPEEMLEEDRRAALIAHALRPEERRVGKEWVSTE